MDQMARTVFSRAAIVLSGLVSRGHDYGYLVYPSVRLNSAVVTDGSSPAPGHWIDELLVWHVHKAGTLDFSDSEETAEIGIAIAPSRTNSVLRVFY